MNNVNTPNLTPKSKLKKKKKRVEIFSPSRFVDRMLDIKLTGTNQWKSRCSLEIKFSIFDIMM